MRLRFPDGSQGLLPLPYGTKETLERASEKVRELRDRCRCAPRNARLADELARAEEELERFRFFWEDRAMKQHKPAVNPVATNDDDLGPSVATYSQRHSVRIADDGTIHIHEPKPDGRTTDAPDEHSARLHNLNLRHAEFYRRQQ